MGFINQLITGGPHIVDHFSIDSNDFKGYHHFRKPPYDEPCTEFSSLQNCINILPIRSCAMVKKNLGFECHRKLVITGSTLVRYFSTFFLLLSMLPWTNQLKIFDFWQASKIHHDNVWYQNDKSKIRGTHSA